MIEVSVVIPSKDKGKLLLRAVNSLITQSFPKDKFEIIIVDDGSQGDNYVSLFSGLKKKFSAIRILNQNHKGPAAARNLGAKNAKGKIIAFTDNDIVATPHWLEEIVKPFKDNSVAGVEGKITTALPRQLFTNAPSNLYGGQYLTANLAFRKSALEKAGFFNEKMHFWREDSELAFRVLKNWKIVFSEKAVIQHPPREENPLNIFRYLYLLRNEWVCFFKHPKDSIIFCPSILKDFLKSILALSALALAVLMPFQPIFALFSLALYFFLSLLPFITGKINPKPINSFVLFILLGFSKDLAYPFFLLYGLFDAILFMVRE